MVNLKNLNLLIAAAALILTACQNSKLEIQQLEKGARETLLCEQNFDDFNNHIYNFWLNKNNLPNTDEFREYLEQGLADDAIWSKTPGETLNRVSELATHYYQFISTKLTASAASPEEKLKLLAALEIGDQEDDKKQLQFEWSNEKEWIQSQLRILSLPCQEISQRVRKSKLIDDSHLPDTHRFKTTLPRAVEGLRWAFATAYQSCSAMALPALTETTPNVEGIKVLSTRHPDGIGKKRVYGDLEKILSTHPYYQVENAGDGCFNTRKKPLIYDYGGKPHTTSAEDSLLDFFTDQGSGTSALGIDCSGFIFSAIARGGLKLAPKKTLKAVSVHGISARMFKDPTSNGLICFKPLGINRLNSIQAGDIIASQGHIVMVELAGEDPLGLIRAKTGSECNEQTLNSEGFDFVITHSTPWKEGIGINRSIARDYLRNSETFQKGLVKYAIAFCKAKFQAKSSGDTTISEVTVVRHNGTADCLAPKAIGLRYEACVQQCPLTSPIPSL